MGELQPLDFAVRFIVIMLATYRLSDDMALMPGPNDIFKRFRLWLKKRYPDEKWIEEGITCPICISFWVGFVLTLVFMPVSILDKFLVWMAVISLPTLFSRKMYGWQKPKDE